MKKVSNSERLLEVEKKKKVTFVERNALTIEQIENAVSSEYITIGSHTHTHPILTNCKESEVRCELHSSKQKLESWTGKEVKYFAYPNGDYHFREKQILKELNYRLAFNVQPRYITPDTIKDPYSLPRFSFVEGASFEENVCRMLGIWKFSKFELKSAIYKIKQAYSNLYYEMKRALLQCRLL
jgi:peptidoglycan/xylan/chitin deacetylase (PgdA/CDA1 family)